MMAGSVNKRPHLDPCKGSQHHSLMEFQQVLYKLYEKLEVVVH